MRSLALALLLLLLPSSMMLAKSSKGATHSTTKRHASARSTWSKHQKNVARKYRPKSYKPPKYTWATKKPKKR